MLVAVRASTLGRRCVLEQSAIVRSAMMRSAFTRMPVLARSYPTTRSTGRVRLVRPSFQTLVCPNISGPKGYLRWTLSLARSGESQARRIGGGQPRSGPSGTDRRDKIPALRDCHSPRIRRPLLRMLSVERVRCAVERVCGCGRARARFDLLQPSTGGPHRAACRVAHEGPAVQGEIA